MEVKLYSVTLSLYVLSLDHELMLSQNIIGAIALSTFAFRDMPVYKGISMDSFYML